MITTNQMKQLFFKLHIKCNYTFSVALEEVLKAELVGQHDGNFSVKPAGLAASPRWQQHVSHDANKQESEICMHRQSRDPFGSTEMSGMMSHMGLGEGAVQAPEREGATPDRNITLQFRRTNCSVQGANWKNPLWYGHGANRVPGEMVNYGGSATASSGAVHPSAQENKLINTGWRHNPCCST